VLNYIIAILILLQVFFLNICSKFICMFRIRVGNKERSVYVTYKRNKYMYLRLDDNGDIYITCRRMISKEDIVRFILSKEEWIVKHDHKISDNENKELYGQEDMVRFLGEYYQVVKVNGNEERIYFDGEKFYYYIKENTDIRKLFYNYASICLKQLIDVRRKQWDELICKNNGKNIPVIRLKYMTSRWGSCTPIKAHISMNVRLIHYPIHCLDYVLLHEYAHMLEGNHSKAFYSIIEKYMPNWKAYNKDLK